MPAPTLNNVDNPRGLGFGVALGDRLFRLAVGPGRELTFRTAPLQAPRVDTSSSPEESTAEFGLVFARSEFDGGEGLFRAHQENAAPNRYWDSKGITVSPPAPGEFPQIKLAREMDEKYTTANVGLRLATDGDSLWMNDGTTIYRTDDPEATTPTFVADDPHVAETATDVEDVAVLGSTIYAALGTNGIHRKLSGGSWAHWSDLSPAMRIWSVKGRIVASDGTDLYELAPAGGAAPTATISLAAGDTWEGVADGGSHILAASSNGSVYAFSTDTGSLVLTSQTLFEGEQPTAVGATQGVVAVGTMQGNIGRLWVGALSEGGNLVNLQLIREWKEDTDVYQRTPSSIIGDRTSLYTGVAYGNSRVDVWRYELSSPGLSRHRSIEGAAGCSRGIAVVDDDLWVAVCGEGLYREDATFVSEGYLIGPLGDFYSASDKSWIGARLETSNLTSGMKAELYFTTDPEALDDPDAAAWIRVASRDSGVDDPGELSLTNVTARALAGMVKLYPSADQSESPSVRSFSFRAYPSAGDSDEIVTIPINVSDYVERFGREPKRIPGRGQRDLLALQRYAGRPVLLRVYKPKATITLRGLVEEIATPIQGVTHRGSTTLISQVTVRGRRTVTGSSVVAGVGTLGTLHPLGTTPLLAEID